MTIVETRRQPIQQQTSPTTPSGMSPQGAGPKIRTSSQQALITQFSSKHEVQMIPPPSLNPISFTIHHGCRESVRVPGCRSPLLHHHSLMLINRIKNEIAQAWFAKFQSAATQGDAEQLTSLFNAEQAYLRDILTFSWDYRTLNGRDAIRSYLEKGNTLKKAQIGGLELVEGSALFVQDIPGPNLRWKL